MLAGARCALFLSVSYQHPGKILAGVLLLFLLGSLVYSVLQIAAALSYLSVRQPALHSPAEPVSVLKPLSGLDLDLESNLRTFFEQEYPAFEILFAVRSESDPAVAVVANRYDGIDFPGRQSGSPQASDRAQHQHQLDFRFVFGKALRTRCADRERCYTRAARQGGR